MLAEVEWQPFQLCRVDVQASAWNWNIELIHKENYRYLELIVNQFTHQDRNQDEILIDLDPNPDRRHQLTYM